MSGLLLDDHLFLMENRILALVLNPPKCIILNTFQRTPLVMYELCLDFKKVTVVSWAF